jgi:hypothetical protein
MRSRKVGYCTSSAVRGYYRIRRTGMHNRSVNGRSARVASAPAPLHTKYGLKGSRRRHVRTFQHKRKCYIFTYLHSLSFQMTRSLLWLVKCAIRQKIALMNIIRSRDSSVSEVTGYGPDDRCSIPAQSGIFLFATMSGPATGPTQPPIPCVPRAQQTSREQCDQSVKPTHSL